MSDHTPGPWQQHDNAPVYGERYAATVWGPEGPGHGLIADCRQLGADEDLANAKLIAAAPDLLEAARATLHHLDYLRGLCGDEGIMRRVADTLRAAVDKAEGRGT
jgi:hypothetical protein